MERYHYALRKELEIFFAQYPDQLDIDTIYFGGGTPSTYPNTLLLDTLGILKNTSSLTEDVEITIEVNPGTIKEEQLDVWKAAGINRLSIGVQSLKDQVLKKLNRHQTTNDVQTALRMASERFNNVSIDLILGLPGISADEWKEALATVVTWPITHISMYFLMVHANTPLYFGVKAQKITLPCDSAVVDLYHWSVAFLAEHGFVQYEISSFAKDGFQSRHNLAYWERKPFKGFGLGAYSFDGNNRYGNEKNLMSYLDATAQGADCTIFHETLNEKQAWLEKVMLGLRQTRGVHLHDLLIGLTDKEQDLFLSNIKVLSEHGMIRNRDGILQLTPEALPVENEIIMKLSV